jgi:hypothetical protein
LIAFFTLRGLRYKIFCEALFSRPPEARAVLSCAQRSEEILLRIVGFASASWPFSRSFMFKRTVIPFWEQNKPKCCWNAF